MPQRIHVASDHGGFALKSHLMEHLKKAGHDVIDLGPESTESTDYPLFAHKLCEAVSKENSVGILVCGTGIGMCMAANKCDGIRAALCTNEYMARRSREHNDANVLCLGERVLGQDVAESIVDAFLATEFQGGRHLRRIELFK